MYILSLIQMVVSSMNDDHKVIFVGRPYGGLGILWRKSIAHNVEIEKYDDTMAALWVESDVRRLMFIDIYSPYQYDRNYDEYTQCLGKLTSLIKEYLLLK